MRMRIDVAADETQVRQGRVAHGVPPCFGGASRPRDASMARTPCATLPLGADPQGRGHSCPSDVPRGTRAGALTSLGNVQYSTRNSQCPSGRRIGALPSGMPNTRSA